MERLLEFIRRHLSLILFVFFETVALALTVENNLNIRAYYLGITDGLRSFLYTKIFNIQNYFSLADENRQLLQAYVKLISIIENKKNLPDGEIKEDSVFVFAEAQIVKKTTGLQNNYFIINRGKKDGIEPESAVVSPGGVVGFITNVSGHFSTGLLIINKINGFSAKIKNSQYFGSITWDGKDYRIVQLNEIPNHVKVSIGDTVVTSGYDLIFPPDWPVGEIIDVKKNSDDNFYTIWVRLFEDLKKTTNVIVVKYKYKGELTDLENKIFEITGNVK